MTVLKVLPPIGNSDHSIVSVSVSYSSPSTTFQPFHLTVFQFGKADWDGFQCFLADVPWSLVLSLGPDLAADELSLTLVWRFTSPHVPTRSRPILNLGTLQPVLQQLPIVTMKFEIDVGEF